MIRREIRDPIHGFIERSDTEVKLIDTFVFQRLRRIRQLAMAYLVYPGAVHTRFDHSLGVMHVADRLARQLMSEEDHTIIRLTALLHDIGHGPFSHVSESILKRYATAQVRAGSQVHEQIGCSIVDNDPEIGRIIALNDRKRIIGLLSGTVGESIERSIISGPLDADKQDYLLRDSYFCGVKYGVFDSERLIDTLEPYRDEYERTLAATPDGVYAIEQFVIAKYHMSTQVYAHKTRLVTDAMIVRAIELGIDTDGIDWLRRMYTYDGTPEYVQEFLKWDDQKLVVRLLDEKDGYAKRILQRLVDRQLFKRAFSRKLLDFADGDVRELLSAVGKEPEFQERLEAAIADSISACTSTTVDPRHVIVASHTIKSARPQAQDSEGGISILRGRQLKRFDEESSLFKAINAQETEPLLEVYAPLGFDDETIKRKKMNELDGTIFELLSRQAASELARRKSIAENKKA